MKQLLNLVLMTGVFLTGCVSTSTFDKKQAELMACQMQAQDDLNACNSARSELDTKLTVANQELGVFRQAAEARQRKLDELQNQEKQLRERLSKELTDKNVEIEQLHGQIVVRMPDKVVFKSGSADILPQGAEVLDKLADAIKDSTAIIRVEGHTDDTPISGKLKAKYPSNWEFSAARASAVARYFETKHFINPKRLESLGFSMYHPVAPNDSDENKQRNRRIEIVLKPAADPEPAKESAATEPAPMTPAAKP
ncbi:MAG: OmpA family protein [Sulfuricaulis sp.]|uniref:OmpA/MotB family protein n=1 Tax=Sulfuricaulis sp. TaxID=2003553 RepID=UPI003C5BFE0D